MSVKGQVSSPDNPGDSELMAWIRDHLAYPHDYCLIWPFGRTSAGYGMFGREGKAHFAHRYICQLVHGSAPSPGMQVAHSCGNGHKGCVNPRHLSWKTPRENQIDRHEHGTASTQKGRWKLTPDDVAAIRALTGIQTAAVTAARFGVTEANIRQIQTFKTWRTGTYSPGGFASR